jgi:signal recognition particle subunit SEC65
MPDHFYIYPTYITGSSRASGRRVPKAKAVTRELPLEDLLSAVKSLGLEAVAETDKHYPRAYWKFEGRVKVTKKPGMTKGKVLKALTEKLSKAAEKE